MRGEHSEYVIGVPSCSGSSPHARGALAKHSNSDIRLGIIPACAGSTGSAGPAGRCRRDHPRMRGEHNGPMLKYYWNRGSSPHARGALRLEHASDDHPGIIPACAGSTHGPVSAAVLGRDHPRMRGEHLSDGQAVLIASGSSPHARGARELQGDHGQYGGIIPACAGSTFLTASAWRARWDHPRMRGEHWRCSSRGPPATGSSPHARGAQRRGAGDRAGAGIIPACAGSTHPHRQDSPCRRDHPRMRGEHALRTAQEAALPGSSPHARGAQLRVWVLLLLRGIIPACAGSTRY